MQNLSSECETAAALACAITLKGERVRDCAPVNLQSEPFQLRAASRDNGYTASRKRLGFVRDMPWNNRVHPTITGSRTYGHRLTFTSFTKPSFTTRPSFSISTFVSTDTSHAGPTTLVLPQATSETDKRAPEGFSKVAVGIGVGAAVAVLLVGLMSFFPLRRRFRRWRWRRMDAQSHELRRPAWIIDQTGETYPGGNQPGMTEEHVNPVTVVSEVHGTSRPTPELGPGVPLERVQLRRDNRHDRRDHRPGRVEERPERNDERSEGRPEERAAESSQKRVEEVVEERSDGRIEDGIDDGTEERTEVMTEEMTAERIEDGTEEGVEKGIEDGAGNEMEEQDEERNEERIQEPFELP